jgi:O-antigen/teichoic acid export membrane protein
MSGARPRVRVPQLLRHVVVYGAGDVLLKATAFVTLPIYTRLFTPADYGAWSYVMTTMAFAGSVLALGGESAYCRYYFEAETERERQDITSTWILFLAGWSIVAVALCLPSTSRLSEWSFGNTAQRHLFALALLAVPCALLNQICGQVLRNQFRASLFSALNALTTLLTVGLSLFAVVRLQWGIAGLLSGALLAAMVMLPIRLWTVRTMLRPVFSTSWLRRLLAYGLPLLPASVAYWVLGLSDRLILGKLASFEEVGFYAVASSLTAVLALASSAFGQAWSPHALQAYEQHPAAAPHFCGRVMTYLLAGFGLLSVGLAAFAPEALLVLSTPSFHPAALAVGPLALGVMASATTQITALGITLSRKTAYFAAYACIGAVLNVVLDLWLIPRWGMLAAAWSTTISYVVVTVACLATSQRLRAVAYEIRPALTAIVLTCAFTLAVALLPHLDLLTGCALKSLYCLTYVGLLYALRVVDPSDVWVPAPRVART